MRTPPYFTCHLRGESLFFPFCRQRKNVGRFQNVCLSAFIFGMSGVFLENARQSAIPECEVSLFRTECETPYLLPFLNTTTNYLGESRTLIFRKYINFLRGEKDSRPIYRFFDPLNFNVLLSH